MNNGTAEPQWAVRSDKMSINRAYKLIPEELEKTMTGGHVRATTKKLLGLIVFLALVPCSAIHGGKLSLNDRLTTAAAAGDRPLVETLLAKGADINGRDRDGLTALMWAAERWRLEMVEELVNRGAHVNAQSKYGATALKKAVDAQAIEVVRLLLQKGASVNARLKERSTALMWAAVTGRLDLVKLLVSHGADVNAKARDGSTALMWAAVADYVDVAKYLERHGAEISLGAAAMLGNNEEVLQLIEDGAYANATDADGWTPLMNAAQKGHVNVVKLLLRNRARLATKRKDGSTAFMDAIGSGRVDLIKLLLDRGALSEQRGQHSGRPTPLTHAAGWGQAEVVKLILEREGDPYEWAVNCRGVFRTAAMSGQPKVLKLLFTKGADISTDEVMYAIGAAACRGHTEVVELLLDKAVHDDATKERGGLNALMEGARYGQLAVVRVVLNRGVDVNARDTHGLTALMRACGIGRKQIPGSGHLPVVKLLLSRGADVNARLRSGTTALTLAQERYNKQIVDLLRAHGAK